MDAAKTRVTRELPGSLWVRIPASPTSVVLLFRLVFAGAAGAQEDLSDKLLGRWRSVETSRGGIGSLLTFQKEGVLEFSPAAVVEMSYRIEGNQLILPPATINGPEQHQTMTWVSKDTLRLDLAGGQPGIQLVRRTPLSDSANPIWGEWRGVRDRGGNRVEATYLFYSGDNSLLLIPFVTQRGSYSLSDRTIHLVMPGGPPVDGRFKLEGQVLTVTAEGRSTTYKRY